MKPRQILAGGALWCCALSAQALEALVYTGDPDGSSHHMISELAQAAEDSALQLKPVATSGTLENLKRLSEDASGLAVVVDSVFANLADGDASRRALVADASLIHPLHYQTLQLVVAPGISSIDALQARPVIAGESGSELRAVAVALADALGIEPQWLPAAANDLGRLTTNEAAAMLVLSDQPLQSLVDFPGDEYLEIFPLTISDLPAEQRRHYRSARIDAALYPWLEQPLETLAVRRSLVSAGADSKDQCYRVHDTVRLIAANLEELRQGPNAAQWREVAAVDGQDGNALGPCFLAAARDKIQRLETIEDFPLHAEVALGIAKSRLERAEQAHQNGDAKLDWLAAQALSAADRALERVNQAD